jgi:hypothetical protein
VVRISDTSNIQRPTLLNNLELNKHLSALTANVFRDAPGEESRLLGNQAHAPAQKLQIQSPNIVAIKLDSTAAVCYSSWGCLLCFIRWIWVIESFQ